MKKLFLVAVFLMVTGALFADVNATLTAIAILSQTETATATNTPTATPTNTKTSTATVSPTATPTVTQTFTQTPAITPVYKGNGQSMVGYANSTQTSTLLYLGTYTITSLQNLYSQATPGSVVVLQDAINPWSTAGQAITVLVGIKGEMKTGTPSHSGAGSGTPADDGIVFKKGVVYNGTGQNQIEAINGH
jgi:hypothetical protein